jgi:exonuclease I
MIAAIKEYFSQARRIKELEEKAFRYRDLYYNEMLNTARQVNVRHSVNERLERDNEHLKNLLQQKTLIIEKLESEVKREG